MVTLELHPEEKVVPGDPSGDTSHVLWLRRQLTGRSVSRYVEGGAEAETS